MDMISQAVDLLENNGVLVLPTDTIYGFSCHPSSIIAVERILDLKKRDNKPFLLLDNNIDRIKKSFSPTAKLQLFIDLLLKFKIWPDNLTLIADKNPDLKYSFLNNLSTIGIRYCTYPVISEICDRLQSGVTSTSINISGEKELVLLDEISYEWQSKVDLIVPAVPNAATGGSASAIVFFDLAAGSYKILRQGDSKTMKRFDELGKYWQCNEYQ